MLNEQYRPHARSSEENVMTVKAMGTETLGSVVGPFKAQI